nr:MAG TPA: hypothetical protein [Bacteriophage sp.]
MICLDRIESDYRHRLFNNVMLPSDTIIGILGMLYDIYSFFY